jgi:hypothetical protein
MPHDDGPEASVLSPAGELRGMEAFARSANADPRLQRRVRRFLFWVFGVPILVAATTTVVGALL